MSESRTVVHGQKTIDKWKIDIIITLIVHFIVKISVNLKKPTEKKIT